MPPSVADHAAACPTSRPWPAPRTRSPRPASRPTGHSRRWGCEVARRHRPVGAEPVRGGARGVRAATPSPSTVIGVTVALIQPFVFAPEHRPAVHLGAALADTGGHAAVGPSRGWHVAGLFNQADDPDGTRRPSPASTTSTTSWRHSRRASTNVDAYKLAAKKYRERFWTNKWMPAAPASNIARGIVHRKVRTELRNRVTRPGGPSRSTTSTRRAGAASGTSPCTRWAVHALGRARALRGTAGGTGRRRRRSPPAPAARRRRHRVRREAGGRGRVSTWRTRHHLARD